MAFLYRKDFLEEHARFQMKPSPTYSVASIFYPSRRLPISRRYHSRRCSPAVSGPAQLDRGLDLHAGERMAALDTQGIQGSTWWTTEGQSTHEVERPRMIPGNKEQEDKGG